MAISSTQPTTPRKRQHRWIAALVALGLTATGVIVYTAAAHAATELTTYVSDANGGTSQVDATVLTPSTVNLTSGFYVCNSAITMNLRIYIQSGNVSIILADGCNLSANGSGGPGLHMASGTSVVFYGGINNTGIAQFKGDNHAGINAVGPVTINGGRIAAIGESDLGGAGHPGIGVTGTSATPAPGHVTIRWNANVYAVGSSGTTTTPGGPGIGTGSIGSTSPPMGAVTINTTGIVNARPGSAGSFTASPGIGRGTNTSSSYSATIPVYNISRNSFGPGSTYMNFWASDQGTNVTNGDVAVGSAVTFVMTPNSNAKLRTVDAGLTLISGDGIGTSTYRLPVTSGMGNVTKYAYFWYTTTPTVTTTPAGTQTFPGNVTINGSITQNSTSALIGSNGQAQLWINGVLAQTQNVAAGKVAFTHTAPPIGTYSYQIKYLGVTAAPYLATSESAPLTGFEVLGNPQNPLSFTGLDSTNYTYGDAPIPVTLTGGSGTGVLNLTSSHPAVASFGTITAGSSPLTINQAGTFTVTGTRAGDTNYAEATITTPSMTVAEATPVATLTRTGGDTQTTPVDATMTVEARGTGTTPEGYVQFSLNSKKLGDPLPLVDNGDGTASVSLTGIPLAATQSHSIQAEYLGQTGKYTTVTKTSNWYLGEDGFCPVPTP